MRWQTVIVLLAIALSIVIPPSLPLIGRGGQAAIGTLDVCHSAAPLLPSNGKMPCLNGYSSSPLPSTLQEIIHIVSFIDTSAFIVLQDERPPKRPA